ncbi:hypothetical protein [uncultured Kordia sp.]|uniref:hypothetical protein n=1 Tax=uncultured Kordia sp. TaxID=507699 RepID=UPI002617B616|nr:hypothetical protein [uncultured Kordia sp.]
MSYRYLWDFDLGNKVHGNIEDSGIFKNAWAELTNDSDYIQIYGYFIKFPVVYVAILTQLILIFKRTWINKTVWLYVINAIFYGIFMYLFLVSFDRHKIDINLKFGSFLYFGALLLGILKETIIAKK